MIDLPAKLGEINGTEHDKGSKIYPQNQVIFDCIMSTIPLKHKLLSIKKDILEANRKTSAQFKNQASHVHVQMYYYDKAALY